MPAKADRPNGWGKKYVLECLRRGEGILAITQQAAQGTTVAGRTLYGDVRVWLKKDSSFREEYRAAMIENVGRVPRGGAPRGPFDETGQEAFFDEMARNGGKVGPACDAVGVAEGYVYSKINPEHPDFDAAFAQRFHFLEAARHGRIREGLLDDAEAGNSWAAQQVLAGSPVMGHLHNPKRRVEVTGKVQHTHELSPAALAQIEARQRLWQEAAPPAAPALPAGRDEECVIDVSSVRVPVEVST